MRFSPAPSAPAPAAGFTLLEVILAAAASAIIFAAVFGIFSRAIHLRNDAVERARQTQLRARATTALRDDLASGYVSGGLLATLLVGARTAPLSRFPGYLHFTTTTGTITTGGNSLTGRSTGDLPANELQEVEYYVATDLAGGNASAGTLVRVSTQDLLSGIPQAGRQEALLGGVSGMEVMFYDGQSWVEEWDASSGSTLSSLAVATSTSTPATTEPEVNLPQAIRVRLTFAPTGKGTPPAPLELVVPWMTQATIPPPASATSTSTSGTGTGTGSGL